MKNPITWVMILMITLISCDIVLTDNSKKHEYSRSVLLEEDLIYHLGYDDHILPEDSLRKVFYEEYPFVKVESFRSISDSIKTNTIYQSTKDGEIAEVFAEEANGTFRLFYYRKFHGLSTIGHVYTMNSYGQVKGFLEVNIW